MSRPIFHNKGSQVYLALGAGQRCLKTQINPGRFVENNAFGVLASEVTLINGETVNRPKNKETSCDAESVSYLGKTAVVMGKDSIHDTRHVYHESQHKKAGIQQRMGETCNCYSYPNCQSRVRGPKLRRLRRFADGIAPRW